MLTLKQHLGFAAGGTPRASNSFTRTAPFVDARLRRTRRLTWRSQQQAAALGPNQASAINQAELDGMHIMEQTVPITLATEYMKTAMKTATELVGQMGPGSSSSSSQAAAALDRVEAALKSGASKQDVSALQDQMRVAVAAKADVAGVKASIDDVAAHVSSVDDKLAGFQAEMAELKAMLAAALSAASVAPTTNSTTKSGSSSSAQTSNPAAPPVPPSAQKEEKDATRTEHANRAPLLPSSSSVVRLTTTDGAVITADRQLLATSSKVVSDILTANTTCDTFALNAPRQTVELLLQALNNQRHPRLYVFTQDASGPSVWDEFKPALELAHKYDMQVAKDRIEKWLISRRLRGEITMGRGFSFNSFETACDWLQLCCKYGMRELGWYMAHDVGGKLMTAGVPPAQVLAGITDTELLMVIVDRSTGSSRG